MPKHYEHQLTNGQVHVLIFTEMEIQQANPIFQGNEIAHKFKGTNGHVYTTSTTRADVPGPADLDEKYNETLNKEIE